MTRLRSRFFEPGGMPSGSRSPFRSTVTLAAGTSAGGRRRHREGDRGPGSGGGFGRRRHRRRPGKGPSQKGPRDDSPKDGALLVVAAARAHHCEAQGRHDKPYMRPGARNVAGIAGRHRLTIPILNVPCAFLECNWEEPSAPQSVSGEISRRPGPPTEDILYRDLENKTKAPARFKQLVGEVGWCRIDLDPVPIIRRDLSVGEGRSRDRRGRRRCDSVRR